MSVCLLTSQPSLGLPLQLRKPLLHDWTVQAPATHAPLAWAGLQAAPQAPQFCVLVASWTSQPSAARPLQLANPGLHDTRVQLPEEHETLALSISHLVPQAVQ